MSEPTAAIHSPPPASAALTPPPRVEVTDREMQRFRERVAAAIALTVIAGAVVMMVIAILNIDTENFERIKDLLLFVNPLLGVVIGYYFNKVSTEARAETAETAASTAMASAQREAVERQAAAAQAEANRERMQEARSTLAEVAEAAEAVLAQESRPRGPGVLGAESSGESPIEARLALQAALARARRMIP